MVTIFTDSTGKFLLNRYSNVFLVYEDYACCWYCIYVYDCNQCPAEWVHGLDNWTTYRGLDCCCNAPDLDCGTDVSCFDDLSFSCNPKVGDVQWCSCPFVYGHEVAIAVVGPHLVDDKCDPDFFPWNPDSTGCKLNYLDPDEVPFTCSELVPTNCCPCDYVPSPGEFVYPGGAVSDDKYFSRYHWYTQCSIDWTGETVLSQSRNYVESWECDDPTQPPERGEWHCECIDVSTDPSFHIWAPCSTYDYAIATYGYDYPVYPIMPFETAYTNCDGFAPNGYFCAICPYFLLVEFECDGTGEWKYTNITYVGWYDDGDSCDEYEMPGWALAGYCSLPTTGHTHSSPIFEIRANIASSCVDGMSLVAGPFIPTQCNRTGDDPVDILRDEGVLKDIPGSYFLDSDLVPALEACDISCYIRLCCTYKFNAATCAWDYYDTEGPDVCEDIDPCACTAPGTLYYTAADGWKYYKDGSDWYAVKCFDVYDDCEDLESPPYDAYMCCRFGWDSGTCTWGEGTEDCTTLDCGEDTELCNVDGWYYCRGEGGSYYASICYDIEDLYGGATCDDDTPPLTPYAWCVCSLVTGGCEWVVEDAVCPASYSECFTDADDWEYVAGDPLYVYKFQELAVDCTDPVAACVGITPEDCPATVSFTLSGMPSGLGLNATWTLDCNYTSGECFMRYSYTDANWHMELYKQDPYADSWSLLIEKVGSEATCYIRYDWTPGDDLFCPPLDTYSYSDCADSGCGEGNDMCTTHDASITLS